MFLSLNHRHVGDAVVVSCSGRITAGAESDALQQYLDGLAHRSPHIVLHLGGVEFIDSGGFGLLVRGHRVRRERRTNFTGWPTRAALSSFRRRSRPVMPAKPPSTC